MHRWRHLIENTFAEPKEFRAVATRYHKTDTSYAAAIHLAAAVIASRCPSTGPSKYGMEWWATWDTAVYVNAPAALWLTVVLGAVLRPPPEPRR